jgi:hypothetical protein
MLRAMNRWLVFLVCSIAMCGLRAAPAESAMRASKPEVKKEIVAVIEAQLGAFRKGDVRKAYSYAAAALRAQKSMSAFSTIVRSRYPEIWANTRAEFGIARDDGQEATIVVDVFTKSGSAAYDFSLRKERAGWRVDGVLRHEPAKREML